MADQVLDNVVWSALTTEQRGLAEGGPLAWRYPSDMAPFAALDERSAAAFEALRRLIPPEGRVALFTLDAVPAPAGCQLQRVGTAHQMVARDSTPEIERSAPIVALGEADVPDMMRLVGVTKPGPFGRRTPELGAYLGIRGGGELVAMAGERFRLPGYVEISAVCVHPDHRGRGYAAALLAALMGAIRARGATPILHVFTQNAPAIALYARLGFATRQTLYVTALSRADP